MARVVRVAERCFNEPKRSSVAACLRPYLRDSTTEEAALAEIEASVGDYLADLALGVNERPKPVPELERLRKALLEAADAVDALDDADAFLLPNETPDARELRRLAYVLGAGLIRARRWEAKYPAKGGRPKDRAARDLGRRLARIWKRHTGRRATPGRGQSPWETFLSAILKATGADVGSERLARDLALRTKPT